MTIFRGTVLDTPGDEVVGTVRLRAQPDAALLVEGGMVTARGAFADVVGGLPSGGHHEVVDLREGLVLPGLVDAHVHYPQVRVLGALGMPLLQWLEECALPEEARLESVDYARGVAAEFVHGLVAAGTTTALVFGSHFAGAVDAFFEAAARAGVRVAAGLVASDRALPRALLTTPDRYYEESLHLARRWHRTGLARYAVTPRFSYSASDALLAACSSVLTDVDGALFTSHVNESNAEVAAVAALFRTADNYVDTYDRHGLVGPHTVLAHNVHTTTPELTLLSARGSAVAHCPSSNAALGSGLFPLRRHVEHGVRVALGSDVGAGTGFSLFKEALQAYLTQRLLGTEGLPLTAPDLLHLATRSGAEALGLGDEVGDLSVGKQFDAVWVRPRRGDPLDVGLRHAASAEDALGRALTLTTPADLGGVWVGGQQVSIVCPSPRASPTTHLARHQRHSHPHDRLE
ncbi:guanine deaminase [Intrasporangium calvum]|uniref:Guanine deaminase n=1 Tax=Intrasporangium calvum (strain ATCC 23552 / DSM 43043 / JCM 3097 / NBRC 12989 / NCIMB 10167 / NRRL B-3866 / 7 KIP) TaxID=710696 RepID=E6S7T9_INTC7|nr:guanine deaminase [Intrasporangium calvum]ADU47996.1 guanine deaminase [Intrasporangium calvum DSM 43043]